VVETGVADGMERGGTGVAEEEKGTSDLGERGTEGASVVETGGADGKETRGAGVVEEEEEEKTAG
jgi:hypothetical protein